MRPAKYFYDNPLPKYLDPKSVLIYRPHPVLVGADCMLQDNSRRYMTFAAPTIISCKYYYILLLWRRTVEISIQDGGLIKEKKNAHHHTPIPST